MRGSQSNAGIASGGIPFGFFFSVWVFCQCRRRQNVGGGRLAHASPFFGGAQKGAAAAGVSTVYLPPPIHKGIFYSSAQRCNEYRIPGACRSIKWGYCCYYYSIQGRELLVRYRVHSNRINRCRQCHHHQEYRSRYQAATSVSLAAHRWHSIAAHLGQARIRE